MSGIRFNYLYRDGSNYKSWGEVIFSNPDNLSITKVEEKIIHVFLPDKQFIASQISIPEKFLFMDGSFTEDDHCYHEFDCVEICEEEATDISGRSITDFLLDIEAASKQGWEAFDVLDRA